MSHETISRAQNWFDRLGVGRAPFVWVLLAAFAGFLVTLVLPLSVSIHAGALFLLAMVAAIGLQAGFQMGLVATLAGLAVGVAIGPERGIGNLWSGLAFCALGLAASASGAWAMGMRRQSAASALALKERDAHLTSIFDTAPEAMIVINEAGIIQSYGASAERMFTWRPGEVLGRNINMLMPPPFREQHDGYLRRYGETGERRIIGVGRIVVGQRKDGSTFPMELAVGEVQGAHGRFFTGFVRDLTTRQEREARVEELQSELTHVARVGAMGQMASTLAHELNQPLSAIANYLSGARRLLERQEGSDARVVEAVEEAAGQALRAGDIIRRLRDFLGRGDGEREVESLSKIVHEACSLALVGASEDGVGVDFAFDPRRDRVVVDRVQIQQVVVNLVRNARDAMQDQSRKQLRVMTSIDGDMGIVAVSDTGAGLSEDAAARLFEPFVTTKAHGMGVGLSISRTIVEAHGGRIWAAPNPGGGAIFSFTVRRALEQDEASNHER